MARGDLSAFSDGITALLRNDPDDPAADAAAMAIAEVLVLHRAWLLAHVKKD